MPSISVPLVAAGIGAAGSLGSAAIQAGSANDATNFQKQVWGQTQQNLAPFVQAGPSSIANLQGLVSGSPQGMQAALAGTPGYQFQLDQGLQALINKSTATGGVGGGNTLKALMGYGQGLAGTTYQNAVGNALNVASLSENAAAGQGSLGVQSGSNIANTITQGGNAWAGGVAGAANNVLGGGSNYLLASLLSGGGGGGGPGPGLSFAGTDFAGLL